MHEKQFFSITVVIKLSFKQQSRNKLRIFFDCTVLKQTMRIDLDGANTVGV